MAAFGVENSFLGSAWTFWGLYGPSQNSFLTVTGARQAAHAIISVCLIRKGEDPQHPDFGLAANLFTPLSYEEPEYWVYHVEEEIRRWVAGLSQLQVKVSGYNNSENQIETEIGFVLESEPSVHILTFPFYQYQGAILEGDFEPFIAAISLDGQPFTGLR